MSLHEYHTHFENGVRWRVVPAGVEIDGTGVERTRGEPRTVTRVWEAYAAAINKVARERHVPCALILATICTESGGDAAAVRQEPGYVSDEKTPHKVSPGLMQTLISTAREAMQMSLDRAWLLDPANSIAAGTAYIAQQAKITKLDPPLVAAAYNAGRLAQNDGAKNRWKLRQFPIGTGEHVDRFVRFFNDAVFVLSKHPIAPSITMYECNPDRVLTPAGTGGRAPERPVEVEVRFAKNAREADVTAFSMGVLKDTLRVAQLKDALISSTSRNPTDQARVMYDNLEQHGVAHQKDLYGPGGDRVIDVYAKEKAKGKSPTDIKAAMEREINEIGPTKVSRHASDPKILNVFDVAPSSIKNHRAFENAVKAEKRVTTFLIPPRDPGFHLEIPQPKQQ